MLSKITSLLIITLLSASSLSAFVKYKPPPGSGCILKVPQHPSKPTVIDQEPPVCDLAVDTNNDAALALYQQLRETQPGNLLFSPYSFTAAMAMAYGGARGDTEVEFIDVLHFPEDQEDFHFGMQDLQSHFNVLNNDALSLYSGNSVWVEDTLALNPDFESLMKSYGEALEHVDFISDSENARQKINAWVEEKTHDRIKDLVPKGGVDTLTRLVLVNALYMKAQWAAQFKKQHTKAEVFHLSEDNETIVQMMHIMKRFPYYVADNYAAVELPYRPTDDADNETALVMRIYLPHAITGLNALEKELIHDGELLADAHTWKMGDVKLSLPKFRIESTFSLADILKKMGMTNAFNEHSADFSGMTDQESLHISNVFQKTFVDVDEEGTEAAAATAVIMMTRTALIPKTPYELTVDHPFLFTIVDKTSGTILFMGRVEKPQ